MIGLDIARIGRVLLLIVASLVIGGSAVSQATAQSVTADGQDPFMVAETSRLTIGDLRSRGVIARQSSLAQVMRRAGSLANQAGGVSPGCGQHACICTGAACLTLIDSNKCNADTFHCAPSDKGPVCVCEQK